MMRAVRVMVSRWLDVFVGQQRDRRVREEVEQHLDLLTDDFMRQGLSPAEAALAARKAFGGVDQVLAQYRDQRGWPWLGRLLQDGAFAARQLTRDGAFTATAVAVLGLGIGVSHLFFTLTYAHTMHSLPIPAVDRVLYLSTAGQQGQSLGLSYPEFRDLESVRAFSDLAGFTNTQVTLGGEGEVPDRVDAAYATASGFRIAGATARLGRLFAADDERTGAPTVVLLTERVWRDRYAMDPAVPGRRALVGGVPATIVGVVADASGFPSAAAVFLPLAQQPGLTATPRDGRGLRVFGRLHDQAGPGDAVAEVAAVSAAWEAAYPASNRGIRMVAVPIDERYNGPVQGWLPFMLAGLIVVAVASANVGNLLLTRGAARAREVAIRTALGASRGRVARQLLIESTFIGVAACAVGFLVSRTALAAYGSGVPAGVLPYWIDYAVDRVVAIALLVISLATVVVCALVPAFVVSRTEVVSVLKDGGRADTGRASSGWGATAFLGLELALAVVLLTQVGAATVNSLAHDVPTDRLLYDTRVLTGALSVPVVAGAPTGARREYVDAVLARTATLPGVTAASLSSHLPLGGAAVRRLHLSGRPMGAGEAAPLVGALEVTAGYFDVIGMPLARGRAFAATDHGGGSMTVIINERLARLHFPAVDPVGQRIAVVAEATTTAEPEWRTIVGVVGDLRQRPLPDVQPLAYLPMGAAPASAWLLVRAGTDAAPLTGPVREVLRQLDPNLPLSNPRTLAAATRDLTWAGRVSARLATMVCLATFLLATVGLYAVVAHRAAQRRREFGLRVVLGARAPALIALVTGHVRVAVLIGLAGGVAGAIAWDRTFSPVRQTALRVADPLVLAVALGVLALVVALGCAVPVRRAIGISPAEALREE